LDSIRIWRIFRAFLGFKTPDFGLKTRTFAVPHVGYGKSPGFWAKSRTFAVPQGTRIIALQIGFSWVPQL